MSEYVRSGGSAAPELPDVAIAGGLRARAARGTLINAAFMVALNFLSLARGFVVAAFLTRGDYGIWGALTTLLGTMIWLKDIGINDRYVQQQDEDQALAFQKAFTLELSAALALTVLMVAISPLFAVILGRQEVLLPGLALAALIPAIAFQAPIWIYYRQMQYVRQRTFQAVEPVVGFVVTVALALAGLGYWSLVLGAIVGAWTSALVAIRFAPHPLRLVFDRQTLRAYVGFSWPLLAGSISGVVIAQASVLAGNAAVGLAGLGAIALASSITSYANQVDTIVTETLYPAVCRVRDRADILFESFVKSNRLALIWGVPFGAGIALFIPDLVRFGIGEHWRAAVGVVQVFAVVAGIYQIGFNWTVYYRAIGRTRPVAIVGAITAVTALAIPVPLLLAYKLPGLEVGLVVMALVQMSARVHYLKRLFPQFRMVRHSARALAPSLPAVAVVLALRLVAPNEGAELALLEMCLFVVVTVGATALFERDLMREVLGYVRGRGFVTKPVAAAS